MLIHPFAIMCTKDLE